MADYERLCAAVGSEAPGLTLDIGHVYVNEPEEPPALIARHAEALLQVHLEDMRRGLHDHLVPGEGEVDFDRDLAALASIGFRRAVCFELSRSSHMAPDALRICRSVWDDAARSGARVR